MLKKNVFAMTTGAIVLAVAGVAFAEKASHVSPYAGQEARQITSLSEADVEELTRGGGWGLAKAAELNGMPGPAHLLEMKNEIGLSSVQVSEIIVVRDAMRAEAKRLGRKLIDMERALDEGFKGKSFTPETLEVAVVKLGNVRAQLRFAHLSAHLLTPQILTDAQVSKYNQLRGYASGDDPCANAPTGHNVAMWRKHNGCE